MRYQNVNIETVAYELPPNVVSSASLEQRLAPVYQAMKLQVGQLAALTGIRERRYWNPGTTMAHGAALAGKKAIARSKLAADDIGMLIYAGVCRDFLEPANACEVAHELGLNSRTQVFDISNACLGVINGIVQIANAIELGHVRAGMVVSCESARPIVDLTIDRLQEVRDMETLRLSLATLTGGSGAIAVIVTHRDLAPQGHRVVAGAMRARPEHHELCRWMYAESGADARPMHMTTDATAVLEHGVALGRETWEAFLENVGWTVEQVDRTICHQVGAPHRETVLKLMGVPMEKDFQTFEFLGNIGTVSLPITAAIAEERGFLENGHRVAMCGIGSGLNCMMLGVEW